MADTKISNLSLPTMRVGEVPGPVGTFEHLGNDQGAPLEVSLDRSDWTTLYPGESIPDVNAVDHLYVRNPNNGTANFFFRIGRMPVRRADNLALSRDGRHAFGREFYVFNSTAITNVSPTVVPAISAGMRRPHLKGLSLFNRCAALVYVRIRWDQGVTVPVPGVSSPQLQFVIPALSHLALDFTHGIGNPNALVASPNTQEYMYAWVTAGAADLDNTAPADAVFGVINVC